MTGGRALAAYDALDVLSMTPPQRVVFLYTQLVSSLRRAQRCLGTGDVETRSDCLCRAQAIVQELLVALDRDSSGELGDRLAALYGYFIAEIIAVDVHQDATRLTSLIALVLPLLDAWERAARQVAAPLPEAASA